MSESSDPPRPPVPVPPLVRLREAVRALDLPRLGAGLLAAAVVVVGGWWLLRPATTPEVPVELSLPVATPLPSPTPEAAPAEIVVHVAGAVARPGLATVGPEGRVADAVAAAGGATDAADIDRVNLAARVVDGDRIWVPRVGDADTPAVVSGNPGAGGIDGSPAGPVDLNRADADELDELPGVGPATASAIVEHRSRVGGFASVDDLLEVTGIGPAKLDALHDLVEVRP